MQNHQKKTGLWRPLVHFAEGAFAPLAALKLVLTHPRLWPACLLPWLIAGSLGWALMAQASLWASSLITGTAALAGFSATGWMATLLSALFSATTWILGGMMVVWLAALVSIPFADWLAELAEPLSHPPLQPATALRGWWSRAHWRRLKLDLWKSVAGALISVLGLGVSAIPVLGVLGPVILALGFTLQFVSYPQTRRDEGLGASLLFLAKNLPRSIGFGLVLALGFAIPFFSAFLLPLAVVGGTLVYARSCASSRIASVIDPS